MNRTGMQSITETRMAIVLSARLPLYPANKKTRTSCTTDSTQMFENYFANYLEMVAICMD